MHSEKVFNIECHVANTIISTYDLSYSNKIFNFECCIMKMMMSAYDFMYTSKIFNTEYYITKLMILAYGFPHFDKIFNIKYRIIKIMTSTYGLLYSSKICKYLKIAYSLCLGNSWWFDIFYRPSWSFRALIMCDISHTIILILYHLLKSFLIIS